MFHFLKKNFTRSGNIEKDVVKKYFDKTQSLMFDKKAASIEQDHISDFTKDYQCRTILDLGCGEGRYSHCFKNYEYYHGVDFSESFISNTESTERRKFSCSDVVEFYEDKIYDTVLLIGLISNYFSKTLLKRLSGALFGAVIFFVLTNFGVWASGMYGYTLNGIITCYTLAIPFFAYSAISTILFSFLIEFIYRSLQLKIAKHQ